MSSPITRRDFGAIAFALGAQARGLTAASKATTSLDDLLRTGIERRKIPAVAAMVATADKITYQGAFGKRDVIASGARATPDSIFAIASMTKAITSTAALQLVDQGKLKLNDPVSKHIPEFAKLEVLEGFDKSGKPNLRCPVFYEMFFVQSMSCLYVSAFTSAPLGRYWSAFLFATRK